jgi:hypothetical protein
LGVLRRKRRGIHPEEIQYLSSDQILQDARDLYARWPDLPYENKRSIVENITEQITIGKDEVSIDLAYLPSTSEMMAERERTHSSCVTR